MSATTLKVRLTALGKLRAGNDTLSVHGAGTSFNFKAADVQEVSEADWASALKTTVDASGNSLFEIVPADEPAAKTTVALPIEKPVAASAAKTTTEPAE
jgi:hypothetical protein